ncbi:MAG: M13 family metallopeptidase [Polyangiaceae bacterium]
MRRPLALLLPALLILSLAAALPLLASCASAPALAPVPPLTTAVVPEAPPPPSMPLAQTGIETGWMDTSVDPCQDFFAYTCGGFVKSTAIPADRATWGTTQAIQKETEDFLRTTLEKAATNPGGDPALKKIGDYYAACTDEAAVDHAGAAPIKPLLAAVARVRDQKTLTEVVTELHAAGVFPLFDTGPMQDFKDATQMIAGLDQDGIGLPDRDYYLKDDGNMKEVRDFYAGHVGRMLALAGMRPAEVKAAVADVMRIETKIAKLEQDKVTRRNPYKVYHRVDRAGLPGIAKTFPWDAYFAGLGFPDIQAISVNDTGYFTGIDALMHEERPEAWRHYLAWQVVRAKARLLSKPFVDEQFAMRQKLTGQKEIEPRWKRCVRDVDGSLGELLAQPYVAAKFAGDSRERAQALVQAIDVAMRRELESLPWMDEATRKAALAKLDELHHVKIGYPDKWRKYDFEVTRTGYAADAMAAERFELKRQLAKIGKPVDRTEWGMTPQTVNAYYDPSLDEIVLPAGELQPPFFSRDFYPPVNIGDEGGNTVGHEITHGFDDEGSQFDGMGNLRDWWSKETKAKFEEATKCVQDQYSQYDAVPGVKLNGALTSGENIADIGGVKLGFAALQAWQKEHPEERRTVEGFSDEQLYFMAYAQGWCSKETPQVLETMARTNPHSPPRWRVDGPMADVPAFAQAFQCKPGTPMNPGNPAKVCSVW